MAASKPAQKSNTRRLLKLVAFLCFLVAAVLGIRAYFLAHPPSGTPFSALNDALNQNPLTSLDSVNTDLSSQAGKVWGDSITDAFALPASDGTWLKVNNHQNLLIGELSTQGFKQGFVLPSNADGIRLYANSNLLYFTTSTNTSDAILTGIEGGVSAALLKLPSGWEFSSIFFDPQFKQFYLNVFDHSGDSKLQVMRQGGQPIDIVSTSSYQNVKILNVDPTNHLLQFQTGIQPNLACHQLNVLTKTIDDKACIGLAPNSVKFAFEANVPGIPYNPTYKGQIVQTSLENGNQQVFKQGEDGDVFGANATNSEFMATLYYKMVTELTTTTPVLKSLQIINITSKSIVKEFTLLPKDPQSLIMGVKDSVWILTQTSEGKILWQQPDQLDGTWTQINLPVCTIGCEFTTL